nr:MAG TPA: hypothetical protein [Caudoviricetes sp.]
MSGRQDVHEYSRLVEEELKPLASKHCNKMWGGLMLDAYLSWERGEWKDFMERTKQRYEEMEKIWTLENGKTTKKAWIRNS